MPKYGQKIFLAEVFPNTNLSEKRLDEILDLTEDSNDFQKQNKKKHLVDSYIYLPILMHAANKCYVADKRCYPEFLIILI